MKTIQKDCQNELTIKKSRFVCYLTKVDSPTSVKQILANYKIKYPDATHICFAYIIDNYKRFSDDKEPSGTAGLPMLNVLEKKQLNHLLATVIRYFGGTKLGTGGLSKAYTSSVLECLKKTTITEYISYQELCFDIDYKDEKTINLLIKDCLITSKEYLGTIHYIILVPQNDYDNLLRKLETYKK